MLEPIDYETEEPKPVGECAYCDEPILPWEDYYQFEDDLVHDDCVISHIQKFKIYGGTENE
jgi:hypothetical protein